MLKITVKGPKGNALFEQEVRSTMRVGAFKQLFLERAAALKKKKLSVPRVYLTLGDDEKKVPLKDNSKMLSHYIKDTTEVTLKFKALGPQISWTTVFLVEYAGPIIFTLFLMRYSLSIYGKDFEYTLN